MVECEYKCGQEAKYQLKNGIWCCSKSSKSCPEIIRKSSVGRSGAKRTPEQKQNIAIAHMGQISTKKGLTYEQIYGENRAKEIKKKTGRKLTIKQIKERYPFMYKIEEFRENSETSGEKEIEVHCKNHNCENSKEQDGWFVPTLSQIYERHRALFKPSGFEENNFYCSENCKKTCITYRTINDPLNPTNVPLNQTEDYKVFRRFVLERDNYKCQYCEEPATIVHHERPQKLEPFFALDPDYGWSVCSKCHYKYGHPKGTECSTGGLAQKVCI